MVVVVVVVVVLVVVIVVVVVLVDVNCIVDVCGLVVRPVVVRLIGDRVGVHIGLAI